MGEHVGQKNYGTYVKALRDNVVPGGRVLVQQMSRRGRYPGGGPFIESFIAPDMHMRPVGETVDLIEDGGLEVRDVHAMREHYVRTVDAWYDTFESNWDTAVDARRRGGRPGVAALPRRRLDGVPRRPDGRRPDPGGAPAPGRHLGAARG